MAGQGDCTGSYLPSRTSVKWPSSKAAIMRLFLIPTRREWSSFNRLHAVRGTSCKRSQWSNAVPDECRGEVLVRQGWEMGQTFEGSFSLHGDVLSLSILRRIVRSSFTLLLGRLILSSPPYLSRHKATPPRCCAAGQPASLPPA